LLESPAVRVPFTAGWRSPVILLPADWHTWPDFRLRSVLAHELAHIRRADWATAVLAATNRALFWFHPLAWWLERHLAALAEEACDAAAIASTEDPEAYASVVLHFAATAGHHSQLPATAMARTSKVGTRIDRILEGTPMWTETITRGRWLALALLTTPLLYAAAALQQQPPSLPSPAPQVVTGAISTAAPAVTINDERAANLPRAMEARVAANPEDLDARARLLVGYLTAEQLDSSAFAKHMLWLVEHHPESGVFDTYGAQFSRTRAVVRDASINADIDKLWRKQAAAHPASPVVLRHAAKYLFDADPTAALELMKSARLIAPTDPAIASATEGMYAVLALTQLGRRNTPAWQAAADAAMRDFLESNDSGMLGRVGTMLSKFQLRLNGSTPQQSVEDARNRTIVVREMAVKLLDRAIALDPANQDWKAAREGARQTDVVAVQPRTATPAAEPEPAPRSQTEMPRRITVGGAVQQAMLVTAPRAEYPPLARQARIQGTVQLNVIIGVDGRVTSITLLSGHPMLVQAATDAVREFVYKPTTLNGVAVEVATRVDISFTLSE
jgi:TonB family protein